VSAPNPAASDLATEAAPERSPGLGRVTRKLTLVNLAVTLSAVVTSPLQARALGPAGRGDLAAVTVVGTLIGSLGNLGLAAFVVRESAVGTSVRRLIGSVGPMLVVLGICWAAAGPAVARLVAGDRPTVHWLLLVFLLAMPFAMFTTATSAVLWGQQRWRLFTAYQLIVPVGSAVVYGVLFLIGNLTVETAGLTFILLSVVVSALPGLVVLRGAGRPQWNSAIASRGRTYGIKIWLAGLANQTNARLDQLLMTRLVAPAVLGLYVVAVNVSLMQIAFTSAVSVAILPRVAAGEADIAARALRLMLALTIFVSIVVIGTVPVFLPIVFGARFTGAIGMCQILAIAAVPYGAVQIMSNVLAGLGQPGTVARGEIISVVITVPALLIFVSHYGGMGAAVISLVAYSCTAAYIAIHLRRHLQVPWSSLLVARLGDLTALQTAPGIGRLISMYARRRA
jgi:O-antigen/teichoic acid export membrane protein